MEVTTVKNDAIIYRHPWSEKYKIMLADISKRDYPHKDYFHKDILCLDIDTYETDACGNNDRTVDAVMGLCDYNCNSRRKSNERLRMIELRMGYDSANHLRVSELLEKVQHTSQLLRGSRIDAKVYFLFQDNVASVAENIFGRWMYEHSAIRHWEATSPKRFEAEIKTDADFPYTPSHNIVELKNSFAIVSSCEQLCSLIDHWEKEVQKEYNSYHIEEATALREAVCSCLEDMTIETFTDAAEHGELALLWIKDFINTYL